MKLSYKQMNDLRALLNPDSHVGRRGCTNSTLCALRARGLVTLEFVPSEHVAGVRVELWSLTEAGRTIAQPQTRRPSNLPILAS